MDPVYTISIIPTGMGAAGYTVPDNDEMFNTKGQMLQDITTLLGGRVAEEIIFGDITTGASNDIKRATATARSMVMKYGMSDRLGLISYGDDDDEVFIGRDLAHTRSYSEDVAKAIDEEIRRIIGECHDQAKRLFWSMRTFFTGVQSFFSRRKRCTETNLKHFLQQKKTKQKIAIYNIYKKVCRIL